MADFKIVSDFKPAGDQQQAINALVSGINNKEKHQTLLGITGNWLFPLFLLLVLMCFSGCVRTNTPEGWSSGIVVDSILYTGTMDGDVRAIDIEKGDLIWK